MDRSTAWLPQRDYGPDWMPEITSNKKIYGADFIFVYALANNKLKD